MEEGQVRASKLCSWRDPERESIKCRNLAKVSPSGEDFRCEQHWRKSWEDASDKRRRVPALTQTEKDYIRSRDYHVCRLCGEPAHEVDHIKEIIDGGDNRPSNLQLLCDPHHREKTAHEKIRMTPLKKNVSAQALRNRQRRRMGLYQQ